MGVSLREVTVMHKWCFLLSELKIEVKVKPVSHQCGLASLTDPMLRSWSEVLGPAGSS